MRKIGVAVLFMAIGVAIATQSSTAVAQNGNWTTIKGSIVLDDKAQVPAPKEIVPEKDKEECLAKGKFYTEEWIINKKNKGIKNIFVWIEPADAARGTPFPKNLINPKLAAPDKKAVEIDQPCCQFIPHVLAVREGQDVVIKNSAPMPHNAKWDSDNVSINPLIAPKAQHEIKALKFESAPISLTCSIHPYMKAWVRIFDHPYYAVTDEDGNFEIKLAPQGKFKLYVWHETGWNGGREGSKGTVIDIKGNQMIQNIKFKPASK
jgi:hypothetical protein